MPTVTKKNLIDTIADRTDQKRVVVKQTVQTFLDLIIEELEKGNRLEFRDFGVFETKTRAARVAQNPKTLEPVRVPAKTTVKFKVGRLMRERVEEGPGGGGDAHPAADVPHRGEADRGGAPDHSQDAPEVRVVAEHARSERDATAAGG